MSYDWWHCWKINNLKYDSLHCWRINNFDIPCLQDYEVSYRTIHCIVEKLTILSPRLRSIDHMIDGIVEKLTILIYRVCTVHTNSHATNVSQWTCSCRGFLMSRWPMCSHLINSITGMETGTNFFKTVKRQGIYPFLHHSALQNEDIDVQISGKDFIEFIFSPNTKY